VKPEDVAYREKVLKNDLAVVRGIVESTGFFSGEEADIAVELVCERLARGEKSGYHFLFAQSGKTVLGYTCYGPIAGTGSSFDLYWIAVTNHLRRRGTGKNLLLRTEDRIAKMGGTRVYIETSSRKQYAPTQGFYSRCGYVLEAVLKDFYFPGDDKMIFVKKLG
jgi:ribosomal protein S18 acetylase RimI-like enzyme